ncbi:LysR family transcriptional regulator [Pseudoruegeria sp. HB172150]|uniref:LysR family transcriptional regulator n=1 Tax=Pseudoruegeria sp. HB172150 TaxID=2721164 RepID=UPI001554CB96
MDTLENLRTFVAVAEAGSFSEAARRANMSVSVVKKRVDQLEHKVGVQLFERSTRSLKPTEHGLRQLPAAMKLLREASDVLSSFKKGGTEIAGHLRVKVPATMGRVHLMDLLTEFRRENPLLSMEIYAADRMVNPLQEGFDVAVGAIPGSFGGVDEIALHPMRRLVVASPGYLQQRGMPQTPRELSEHDLLNYSPAGETWEFEKDGEHFNVRARYLITCNDGMQLMKSASQGDGITCLSEYLVSEPLARGDLVEVLPGYTAKTYWIYLQIPHSVQNAPSVRALVEHLKAAFRGPGPWERSGAAAGS